MALCTQTQVEQRLQINFTDNSDVVCAELIAAAQGHIERVAGRPIEAGAITETFDGPASTLWLEVTPVNSITSVTVDGTALTSNDYTYTDYGRLARTSNSRERAWSTSKQQSIVVVYNGGYQTVPYDLQDICANVAARAFAGGAAYAARPAGMEGISSLSLSGSDSVSYSSVSTDPTSHALGVQIHSRMGLTPEEHDIAAYYRPPNI